MTDPAPRGDVIEPVVAEPILVVMWHQNRVQVFADGQLRSPTGRMSQQKHATIGAIAEAITDAETVPGMITALKASTVGGTHEIDARVLDGVLQIWLRERPSRVVEANAAEGEDPGA